MKKILIFVIFVSLFSCVNRDVIVSDPDSIGWIYDTTSNSIKYYKTIDCMNVINTIYIDSIEYAKLSNTYKIGDSTELNKIYNHIKNN